MEDDTYSSDNDIEYEIANNNIDDNYVQSLIKAEPQLNTINTVKKRKEKNKKVSQEMKEVIVAAIKSGACTRESAATAFNVRYSTVVKVYRRYLDTGHTKKKTRTVFIPKKLQDEHSKFLIDTLSKDCTLTLKVMADLIEKTFGIKASMTTIAKKISSFHFNIKRLQKVTLAVVTPAIIKDHKIYCEKFLQFHESGRTMIYFDQTEFQVTMRVFGGRNTPDIFGKVVTPSLRKRNKTIVAAMTKDELLFYKSTEGSSSSVTLIDYLKSLFVQLTSKSIYDAVIIIGNAAMFSHCIEMQEMTELAGHELLILPAYSPFLNPLESMFSQWGDIIRSRNPSTIKELEHSISLFNDLITKTDCQTFSKDLVEIAISCTTGTVEND